MVTNRGQGKGEQGRQKREGDTLYIVFEPHRLLPTKKVMKIIKMYKNIKCNFITK